MSTAAITGIVLVLVMLLGSGLAVYIEVKRQRLMEWQPLHFGGSFITPVGYTGPDINRCFEKAIDCLKEQRCFEGPTVPWTPTMLRVSIVVMSAEKWTNNWGQWVGGETQRVGESFIVRVERGASSLCHELAHVMEYATSDEADYEHAGWADKRIWAADEAYRAWLKEQTR